MDDLKPKQEVHKSGWETLESMRAGFQEAALRMAVSGDCDSPYKRRCLAAKKQSEEILARAQAENRPMSPWEEEQARILDRRALCLSLEVGIDESLTTWEGEIEQALRDGKPLAPELPKMLRKIGAAGNEKAQAMLRKYFSPEARQRLLNIA